MISDDLTKSPGSLVTPFRAERQYPKGAPQWGDIVPEAQLSGGPGGGKASGRSRLMGWQLVVMKSTLFR